MTERQEECANGDHERKSWLSVTVTEERENYCGNMMPHVVTLAYCKHCKNVYVED